MRRSPACLAVGLVVVGLVGLVMLCLASGPRVGNAPTYFFWRARRKNPATSGDKQDIVTVGHCASLRDAHFLLSQLPPYAVRSREKSA
jgi:hypothetical protein